MTYRDQRDRFRHITTERKWELPLTFVVLLISILLFHGDALDGGWHLDDGHHLAYAAKYTPSEYFFIPKIIAEFSYNQFLTPWNPLVYDINIFLFGLRVQFFYLHQLLVLLMGAIAFYFLMRQWISQPWALYSSLVLIVGPQSGHLVRDLMCGHYLYGLTFACLTVISYVHAIRTNQIKYAWNGAMLYALTLTTKEIYAPVLLVLMFLEGGSFRSRARFLYPFALVAVAYIVWRYIVLGTFLGGYSRDPAFPPFSFGKYAISILHSLFGGVYPVAAIGIVFLTVFLFKKRCLNGWLLTSAIIAFAGPLFAYPLPPVADRITFGAWLALVMFVAYALHSLSVITKAKWISLAVAVTFLGNTLWHFESAIKINDEVRKEHEVTSNFLLKSNERQAFVDKKTSWYPSFNLLTPLKEAEKIIYPESPKRALITYDEERALNAFNQGEIDSVWIFDPECTCMKLR